MEAAGLLEKIVRPGRHRLRPARFAIAGQDQHPRRHLRRPHCAKHLAAIEPRHSPVEHKDVEFAGMQRTHGLIAAEARFDGMSRAAQGAGEQMLQRLVVFGQQDTQWRRRGGVHGCGLVWRFMVRFEMRSTRSAEYGDYRILPTAPS